MFSSNLDDFTENTPKGYSLLAKEGQNDEHFMRQALREAQKAFDADEVPVGAVIVYKNQIIARAHNQVEMLKDATAHAEMIAMTQASEHIGDWRLEECCLYVTKEPCFMCAGAAVNARMGRIVFGVSDPKLGGCGSSPVDVSGYSANYCSPEVVPGVCADESLGLLQSFFAKARQKTNPTPKQP